MAMNESHSQPAKLTGRPPINHDAVLSHGHSHGRRQYSIEEWRAKKHFIKEFYINNNGTLKALMKELSEKHNFHPTLAPLNPNILRMYMLTFEDAKCTKPDLSNGGLPKISPTRMYAISLATKPCRMRPGMCQRWAPMGDQWERKDSPNF